MDWLLLAVRFAHYVSGIAWVGASLVLAIIVFPALDRCQGQVRAPVMRALARRIAPWETVAATTVVASGVAQAVMLGRGGEVTHLSSRWGLSIAVGAACAVLLVVLGLSVLAPLTTRFVGLEEQVGADPERSAMSIRELGRADPQWWQVRQRLVVASVAETTLALTAVAAMAVARGS